MKKISPYYIINKYKIKYYKLKLSLEDVSFEKENELMENFVGKYEKQIPPSKILGNNKKIEKNEKKFISKKNIVFYENVKDENPKYKGYAYYKNKLFKEKNVKNREQYILPYLLSLHTP